MSAAADVTHVSGRILNVFRSMNGDMFWREFPNFVLSSIASFPIYARMHARNVSVMVRAYVCIINILEVFHEAKHISL